MPPTRVWAGERLRAGAIPHDAIEQRAQIQKMIVAREKIGRVALPYGPLG